MHKDRRDVLIVRQNYSISYNDHNRAGNQDKGYHENEQTNKPSFVFVQFQNITFNNMEVSIFVKLKTVLVKFL